MTKYIVEFVENENIILKKKYFKSLEECNNFLDQLIDELTSNKEIRVSEYVGDEWRLARTIKMKK